VAQAPGGPDEDQEGGFALGGWQGPLGDEESGRAMFEQAQAMDALLLGRKTYEIFAGYWPQASEEIPFTNLLNEVPKYVATRSLTEPLSWSGSTILAGDLVEAVTEVKARHAEVHVIGSLDLLQSLLSADVVDELSVWVYPVLLGSGKRAFEPGLLPTSLTHTRSVTYPAGSVNLVYSTNGRPTFGDMTAQS
jgi:dihydrofolate reductase